MSAEEQRLMDAEREIRSFFLAHADPTLAKRYERYFREGYDAYGIEQAALEGQFAQWSQVYGASLGLDGCLALGRRLFASGKYEEGSLAVVLLRPFRRQLDRQACEGIGGWLEAGVHNWAHADMICGDLLGPALRDGQVALADFAAWRLSPGKFRRRAVPVAMLGLLKAKPVDAEALLAFLCPLMADADRVVHQGVGWFLRELWKVAPAPVEAFLLEYKDAAPRLIYQYATEKMAPADKERFRRAKKGAGGV